MDELIVSDPAVMGGRRVFRNTRVPVEVLFENLADGLSLDEILREYGTLDRDDVVKVLTVYDSTEADHVHGVMRGLVPRIHALP